VKASNEIAVFAIAIACALQGCQTTPPPIHFASSAHSSSMAITADGKSLFVVNPENDSVSQIDLVQHKLVHEIQLGDAAPKVDSSTGTFAPAVMPRAAALSPNEERLYVSGERSGNLYVIDVASSSVAHTLHVGSEPIGVLVSADGLSVFVACSNDATVVRVDAALLQVSATAKVSPEPWTLAASADGSSLLATHFLGPGISEIDPNNLATRAVWAVPDVAPRGDARLAHGQVRGLYDAVIRPGTTDLWVAHSMLGTDTAQPALNFESTAFPALSILDHAGTYEQTLSTDAQDVDGIDGSYSDVVSGPHALAFTKDGKNALIVDANSGDVLTVDAASRTETSLLRPLPGRMPDGIVLSPDGLHAYVDERISGDVAVLDLDQTQGPLVVSLDGNPISRLTADAMPTNLRLGEYLFNSADSGVYPITTNHWIACATCHLEGRSDAVTWKFAQGPRDTPSNAGGMLGTGFLFRTADRTKVQDYWHTINVEQGGHFDPTNPNLSSLLDALSAYVNLALPLPTPPTTDAALVARGAQVFASSGCPSCHSGARFTDSGAGNPTLDLAGPVLLHDVGTCVTTGYPDVAHEDINGDARAACMFDTPSLNGVASSAPYLHDGSAPTIADAVSVMLAKATKTTVSSEDQNALVEYVRSL
jgi:YVTN family beta-propeller protein